MFRLMIGEWRQVWIVALSALAVYLFTALAVRLSERRTLARMSPFDFVVAVSLGAIVGRTATGATPTLLNAAVAVVTLTSAHRCFGWVRWRWPETQPVTDHRPVVLVREGEVLPDELHRCRLTCEDVFSVLREHGIRTLDSVELLVLEESGRFSLFTRDQTPLSPELCGALDERMGGLR